MRSLIVALLVFCSADALSQSRLPPGVRGPETGMATRSVSNYLRLERGLLDALESGKREAVAAMLGNDFAVRSSITPDEMAAADWLKSEAGDSRTTSNVRDLTVREFGDVAVVSFLIDHRRDTTSMRVGNTDFVVDVWQQRTHKLLMRSVAPSSKAAPIPSRPSGRE